MCYDHMPVTHYNIDLVYLQFFNLPLALFPYYMAIIYIVADKVLGVYLGTTYPMYWNKRKTIFVIAITWLIGILSAICISIAYKFCPHPDYFVVLQNYVVLTLDVMVLLVVVLSNSYLFYKVVQSRRSHLRHNSAQVRNTSLLQIFRNSKFNIVTMLVVTFLMFVILPDLFGYYASQSENRKAVVISFFVRPPAYQLSLIIDFYIYVFQQRKVRDLLCSMLKQFCCVTPERKLNRFGNRNPVKRSLPLCEGREHLNDDQDVSPIEMI